MPEDRSSVLLLSVRKVPSSPKVSKRPFSLPLALGVVSSCSKSSQISRNPSCASNGRRPSITRRDSRRVLVAKGERPPRFKPEDCPEKRFGRHQAGEQTHSSSIDNGKLVCKTQSSEKNSACINGVKRLFSNKNSREELKQNSSESSPSVGRFKNIFFKSTERRQNDFDPKQKNTKLIKNNATEDHSESFTYKKFSSALDSSQSTIPTISLPPLSTCSSFRSLSNLGDDNSSSMVNMETSIDSIGTCSLDMEASTELQSDWSEVSSTGTLRSASVLTPADLQQHHLPSYLSLACTVNGYSTTTNYDPVRLARSRDASPHRLDTGSHLTPPQPTYSVTNNLLSPLNLVPLPTPKTNMTENALQTHHTQKFYNSTQTMTFMSSKESHFSSNIFTKDTTDGCIGNSHHTIQRQCMTYESKKVSGLSEQNKCNIESTTISKEYTNGKETKSFIQQRVERLYGPGALAQGFFVSKRKKNPLSESEDTTDKEDRDAHNKTLPDKFLDDDVEPSMKQSLSSPSLPVLRHLRPEFRAQLPIANSKKTKDVSIQKSVTVPKLTDEVKVNGHHKPSEEFLSEPSVSLQNGKILEVPINDECSSSEKDGHYFIRILEEQTARLLELADKAENELNTPNLSEEVIGKLRSASGKARLLVSQKMQQFKGLCTNNITQSEGEAFPTTNEDLQGFWDMVNLQVDQVDKLFEEINKLKENNWKEDTITKVENKVNGAAKPRKAIPKPKASAANEEARKQREEQRKKMIEERRKAMKAAQQSSQPSIEIYVPESS